MNEATSAMHGRNRKWRCHGSSRGRWPASCTQARVSHRFRPALPRPLLAASILVFGATSCGGGDGGVTGLDDLFPSFAQGHSLTAQPGEQYTVGEMVNVTLPSASGGNPPLTYSVTPALPAGLTFNAAARTISGTPTTPQPRAEYDYTVTDADGDTATIGFGITVAAATTSAGSCRVGQILGPGDSCTIGSDLFEVLSDGRGRLGFITAGTGITVNRFSASRIPGTNTWRIDSVP